MRANIEKEIILSPVEAQAGVLLRLNNQVNKKCRACNGSGERLLSSSSRGRRSVECAECDETGTVESREEIDVRVDNLLFGQTDKKIVFENLGNYTKENESRGNLILTIKIENICVEEENRDFTIVSYENLDYFREKFHQEQEDFRREKNKPVLITTANTDQQNFWLDDFADKDDRDSQFEDDEFEEGSAEEIYTPLMQMATADLYEKNAFRLLGVLPGISEREAKRTVEKIQKLRRIGSSINNSQALLPISEIDDESINEASQIIQDAEKSFLHEFFWILPANLRDESENEEFVSALRRNDLNLAIGILRRENNWQFFSDPARLVYLAEKYSDAEFNVNTDLVAEEENILSEMRDLQSANPNELFVNTTKPERNGSFIRIDAKFHERIRRAIEEARIRPGLITRGSDPERLFGAMYLFPETVKELILVLREAAEKKRSVGNSPEHSIVLEQDANTLENAALEGDGAVVAYVFKGALPKNRQFDRLGHNLHNLAVLRHIHSLKTGDWTQTYSLWNSLHKMDSFWRYLEEKRVPQINNPLIRTSTIRQIRGTLPRFLLTINARLAVRFAEQGDYFSAEEQREIARAYFSDEDLGQEILLEAVQPKKEQIQRIYDNYQFELERSSNDNNNKNLVIKNLLEQSLPIITTFKTLLGEKHSSTIDWGTRVARNARNAAVDYGNQTNNWRECLLIRSLLLEFPCSGEVRDLIVKDEEPLTNRLFESEIEPLCAKAAQACESDILQTPAIVKNFLVGSRNLVKSLGLEDSSDVNWADTIVRLARSLIIEYGNETENWDECLSLQSELLQLSCSQELLEQLAEDNELLISRLHESEINDLLNDAIALSKVVFPPVPVVVKDLLAKCRLVLDNKERELGAGDEILTKLKETIFQVANSLLIEYVNDKEDFTRTLEVAKLLKPFAVTPEQQKLFATNIEVLQKSKNFYSSNVLCWFCQENKGEETSNIKVQMYGDIERNQAFNRKEVKWRSLEVTVPRCLSCDAIHLKTSSQKTKGVAIGGCLGLILNSPLVFLYTESLKSEMVWLALIIIGSFIWLGYDVAKEINRISQPKQIKKFKAKHQHPQVLELMVKGWQFNRPSA